MNSRRILVIAPHADDEVLGCGGVMARAIDQGAQVTVCVATTGAPHLFSESQLQLTRREAIAAHRLIGVANTHFLDFPAPLLDQTPHHQLSDAFRALIADLGPDTVFIPHQGDIHHDHSVVYLAALVACRPIGDSPVQRILAYETLSETEWAPPRGDTWFIPNVYVDVDGYVDVKVEAMKAYGSKIQRSPHPRSEEGIRSLATYRGHTVGMNSAEAFTLIRELL